MSCSSCKAVITVSIDFTAGPGLLTLPCVFVANPMLPSGSPIVANRDTAGATFSTRALRSRVREKRQVAHKRAA